MQKLKVAWICHFSNTNVRARLTLSSKPIESLYRSIFKKPKLTYHDFANWVSNGITEFEKFKDIELHIVSPHYGMKHKNEKFIINGINYWFFRPDDNSIFRRWYKILTNSVASKYNKNRKVVKKFIKLIKPDIIHMYGAENPYYSITALDINMVKYPFLISLQTLMNDPEFKLKYKSSSSKSYEFRASIEKEVISQSKYIGSSNNKYRDVIWNNINAKAIFTKTFLATVPHIQMIESKKIYDFVYFAVSISKAADFAVEAFALACQNYPDLTLNIVGATPNPFTEKLKRRIKELGIEKNVVFSGKLKTHDDVYKQIKLSRFALLPQKINNAPGTIREALFNGLPVIAKATPGTTVLNQIRESILLSEPDDHQAMANNMIKLIESPEFARKIGENGLITAKENWNNNTIMMELVDAYRALLDHHRNDTPIPQEIGNINPNLNI